MSGQLEKAAGEVRRHVDLGQRLECPREQRVAGNDGRRLIEHDMDGRPPPPDGIVVHHVIVDQGEVVYYLDGRSEGDGLVPRPADRLGDHLGQNWPEALAAGRRIMLDGQEELLVLSFFQI